MSLLGTIAGGLIGGLFNKKPKQPDYSALATRAATTSRGFTGPLPTFTGPKVPELTPLKLPFIPDMGTLGLPEAPDLPGAPDLTGPAQAGEDLGLAADIFRRMAETGYGTEETERASQDYFKSATAEMMDALEGAQGRLSERLAGRGIGRSGIAAGQARELETDATRNISTLAAQIAMENAQRKQEAQRAGLEGLMGTSAQMFTRDVTGKQNTFENLLRLAEAGFNIDRSRYGMARDNMMDEYNMRLNQEKLRAGDMNQRAMSTYDMLLNQELQRLNQESRNAQLRSGNTSQLFSTMAGGANQRYMQDYNRAIQDAETYGALGTDIFDHFFGGDDSSSLGGIDIIDDFGVSDFWNW